MSDVLVSYSNEEDVRGRPETGTAVIFILHNSIIEASPPLSVVNWPPRSGFLLEFRIPPGKLQIRERKISVSSTASSLPQRISFLFTDNGNSPSFNICEEKVAPFRNEKDMERLGFNTLSLILSYLTEVDGTCLLLTKKVYAKHILPIFRLEVNDELVVVNARKNRHQFRPSPVQDPVILLQRLNTRRLRKRLRAGRNQSTYVTGFSTKELANAEWKQAQQHLRDHGHFLHPPHLELLRFLDKETRIHDDTLKLLERNNGITLLVSYPRSGNTLLRTLIEKTTGIVTGSDTRPDRSLSKALAEAHNLVGEGVTQQSKTCFVKTHWPERMGCQVFEANRAILIIRNPFDAIDSYWNLNMTNTHTETVTDEVYERHQDMFQALAKNEIRVWYEFHMYWLEKCGKQEISLLLIRFEDLIQQPEIQLARIMAFLCKDGRIASFWMERVRHVISNTQSNGLGSYRPRTGTTGVKSIGKSLSKGRYSLEMIEYFHAIAGELEKEHKGSNLLKQFGYDIPVQGFPDNFIHGKHLGSSAIQMETYLSAPKTIKVNAGETVRPQDCPFGRAMRNWRLQHTNNDTVPFPTISHHPRC